MKHRQDFKQYNKALEEAMQWCKERITVNSHEYNQLYCRKTRVMNTGKKGFDLKDTSFHYVIYKEYLKGNIHAGVFEKILAHAPFKSAHEVLKLNDSVLNGLTLWQEIMVLRMQIDFIKNSLNVSGDHKKTIELLREGLNERSNKTI